MDESISIMTWNANGEIGISDDRMRGQLEFLDEYASEVDIVLFQAVNYEPERGGEWGGQLGSLVEHFERAERDYDHVHTADWAHELSESDVQPHQTIDAPHNRCNLTVSRWPIDRTPLSLRSDGGGFPRKLTYYTTHFPEKLLVSEVDLSDADGFGTDSLLVWNVGIINGSNWHKEKLKTLETIYGRLSLLNKRTDQAVVLGGDFNAPRRENASGEIVPHGGSVPKYKRYPFYGSPYYFGTASDGTEEFTFSDRWQRAEANVFDPTVGEWDMRDVYWAAENGRKSESTEDHTHEIQHSGFRKRLDHVFVSDHFAVEYCEILNGEGTKANGLRVSDHAPVVTRLYDPE